MVLAWRPRTAGVIVVGAAVLALAGCSLPGVATGGGAQSGGQPASVGTTVPARTPSLAVTPANQAQDVPLDAPVVVKTDVGRLSTVTVQERGSGAAPAGAMAADGSSWRLDGALDSSATYTIRATAVNGDKTASTSVTFTTLVAQGRLLTTYTPYDGEVVGVGEPIDLRFNTSIPDANRADIVNHIQVSSTPGALGAWHWFTSSDLHFRPARYWQPGTKVTVTANLKGVDAGNGVWGLGNWSMSFTVGPKHVSLIDDTTHTMKVYSGDQLIHTWPVSMGKRGFPTLSGTLVVLYRSYKVKMNSCGTFGGAACIPGNANYYDEYVYYDTAISTNGFFIHAAPWSVYAQGYYDVSHGCVNLSTSRAITFYHLSLPGDVVVITHTPNRADYTNGEADWQVPFAQFANTPGAASSVWTGTPGTTPAGARAA